MNFTFGPQPGQILFFHGVPAGLGDDKNPVVPAKQPPVAMERTDYNSPSPLARFTFATHRTFVSSHQGDTPAADKGVDGESRSKEDREPNAALALRCSKEYRMHMHTCHGELSRLYTRLESGVAQDSLDPMDSALMDSVARTVQLLGNSSGQGVQHQSFAAAVAEISQYLEFSELVWTLCELIHLRPSTVSVASGVVQWALTLECWFDRMPFPEGFSDEQLQEKGSDRFYVLRHHAMRNRLLRARSSFRDMLEAEIRTQNSMGNHQPNSIRGSLFQALDQALAERPAYKPTKAFQRDWDSWKVSLRRHIQRIESALSELRSTGSNGSGDIEELENLNGVLEIFHILNGEGVSARRSGYGGGPSSREVTWIPVLVSELAFNRPGAVASEVARIMDRCIREVGSGDEQRDTIVDNMVQDALVSSMLPVVIQDLFESGHMVVPGTQSRLTVPWVAAHLTDVLSIGGLIPDYPIDGMPGSDGGLRDYYIEEYAFSLQRGGGADVAADYLGTCSFQSSMGHPRMHNMLTRAWSSQYTERATRKLVSIAQRFGLVHAADEICAAKAAHWQARGRTAQSLQWLTRCEDPARLTTAVQSILSRGPSHTAYTTLDTLVHGLEGSIDENSPLQSVSNVYSELYSESEVSKSKEPQATVKVSQPVAFLSRYHEACVVLKNAKDLRREIEASEDDQQSRDAVPESATPYMLDERQLMLARGNLRYLEAEAAGRLSELLCSQALDDNPTFWVPLLEFLEPLVRLRPPVVSAAHSRRILATIEEVTSSWRRDDYLPVILPPWREVQAAVFNIMITWPVSKNDLDSGRKRREFPISAGEYMTLKGMIPLLPTIEELGAESISGADLDWALMSITEASVEKAYNLNLGKSLRRKEMWDGEAGLMPRMRWALTENLAASLGEAHGSVGAFQSTISGVMISGAQPPVRRSMKNARPHKLQRKSIKTAKMAPYE